MTTLAAPAGPSRLRRVGALAAAETRLLARNRTAVVNSVLMPLLLVGFVAAVGGDGMLGVDLLVAAAGFTLVFLTYYNLVTTYPLLVVMFLRAQKDQRWGLLALGLIAIVGERELYGTPGMGILTPHFRIGLQLAFLVLCAIVVAAGDPRQELDTADLDRAGA